MIRTKYPYTFKGIILILILFVPFIIRFKEPRLEIYPAILFPTGAELLKVNEGSRFFQTYEIFAFRDSLVSFNKSKWMGNIPSQYYHYIIKGNLGLENYSNDFHFLHPQLKFEEKNNFTQNTKEEAKEFFKQKLIQQGFSDSILVVRLYKKEFNIKSKQLQSQELIYERNFILN